MKLTGGQPPLNLRKGMFKVVDEKTGSDGKPIDRSEKNVCLSDVEINFLLKILDQSYESVSFSLERELEEALESSSTQFE